jgi:hypothetical protein
MVLVQANDRLGERVDVGVGAVADRGPNAAFGEQHAMVDRQIPTAAVGPIIQTFVNAPSMEPLTPCMSGLP